MGLNSTSVLQKIEDAKRHGLLQLAHCNLVACPPQLFTTGVSTTLLRLDLSGNLIAALPDTIALLTNLQFLWLSGNPTLSVLPPSLSNCTQLRVLDVSETALETLPCELARLLHLVVLDIGSTPLEQRWIDKGILQTATATGPSPYSQEIQQQRCQQILRKLTRKDERTKLKRELYDALHDQIYRVERSDVAGDACLKRTIQRVLKRFPLADEIRSVLRSAERLFPSLAVGASLVAALEAVDATQFRAKFDKLKTENERKKKAADLELKIRALYFDRIDPSTVEAMVQSIYAEIKELSDVKFLLQHATALFPKEAKDVDGKEIFRRVRALQQELAQERQSAIDKLLAAAKAIYSDTEPDQVQQLVAKVASLFKNTKDLRSLAADAATLFPGEFLNAQSSEIRAMFVQQKAEALGTTTPAPASTQAGTMAKTQATKF